MLDHNFVSKLEAKEMMYSVQIEFFMCGKLHVSHQYTTNLDTVMHYSNKSAKNALVLKTLVQLYTYYLGACDSLTKVLSARKMYAHLELCPA